MAENIKKDSSAPVTVGGRDSKIWLWIGVAFTLLFLATLFLIAPQIQQQLDQQARIRLTDAGIDPNGLNLDWDYRNLTVTGYLPNDVSHQELVSILRGSTEQKSVLFADGIRHLRLHLDDGTFLAGGVGTGLNDESLSVEISSNGTVATLNGVVENDAQRSLLVKAILDAGVENIFDHVDVMATESTEPVDERLALLANMLKEIGPTQIKRSEITMTESGLFYRITARDKHSAMAIEKAASSEIADFRVTGGVDVVNKYALDLSARTDGEKITLTGKVLSEVQRKKLVFAAGEAVGSSNVIDQMTLIENATASAASMARVDSIAAVVSRFAPGIDGDVRLNGDTLTVNANAGSEAVRQYLSSATSSARDAGLSVTENISLQLVLDDSEALQADLDQLIEEVRTNVVFASGASVLTPSAMQTLDKIAKRISTYSDLLVEIEGHTDDVGRAAINEQLSQSRANAVREYLAKGEISGDRLIAVGYGHRKPLEPNDTAEGRQANRRVHFTVLKQPANG